MWYLSIVSVLLTVDASRHAPSLEKQAAVQAQTLSNVMLWTGSAAKHILATLKNGPPKKIYIYRYIYIYIC